MHENEDREEIRAALAESELFGQLSAEALEAVTDVAQTITVPPATILGLEGETDRPCCIIARGAVQLFKKTKSGVEIEIIRLGPGKSFGEVSLLSDEPVPASVKTLEETRLIVFSKNSIDPIIEKNPEVRAAIGKGVSLWLHRASSRFEEESELQRGIPRLRWIDFVPIIGLSLICALLFNMSNPKGIAVFPKKFSNEEVSFVEPEEVYAKSNQGKALIVDAMPTNFFEEGHIRGAMNLPLAIFDFMYDMKLDQQDKSKEIAVYGRTISRHYDEAVAEKLVVRGFKNVKILKGGIQGWKSRHYPVGP
jgi:rhodanese-related sulfurtransferase